MATLPAPARRSNALEPPRVMYEYEWRGKLVQTSDYDDARRKEITRVFNPQSGEDFPVFALCRIPVKTAPWEIGSEIDEAMQDPVDFLCHQDDFTEAGKLLQKWAEDDGLFGKWTYLLCPKEFVAKREAPDDADDEKDEAH